jgi:putative transposase
MANSYTRLLYHVVFSTKGRRPLITPDIRADLHAYLGGIVRNLKGAALEVGGVTDHVHLLLGLRAETAVAEAVAKLKANSSSWLSAKVGKQNWFGWQVGYGAFTVSASREETVQRYIQRQEVHHRRLTYQEELVALLKRHRVPFDEKYLLG